MARDGLEAPQKSRELLPDLILLDLRMPGMNRWRDLVPQLAAASVGRHFLNFGLALNWCLPHRSAQFTFQSRQLSFDFLGGLALADDFVTIPAQEVIDGLDADFD